VQPSWNVACSNCSKAVNIDRCEIRWQPKQGRPRFAILRHLILVDSYTMIRGEGVNFGEFGSLAKNFNLTLHHRLPWPFHNPVHVLQSCISIYSSTYLKQI
jgi:hypothetical protein